MFNDIRAISLKNGEGGGSSGFQNSGIYPFENQYVLTAQFF